MFTQDILAGFKTSNRAVINGIRMITDSIVNYRSNYTLTQEYFYNYYYGLVFNKVKSLGYYDNRSLCSVLGLPSGTSLDSLAEITAFNLSYYTLAIIRILTSYDTPHMLLENIRVSHIDLDELCCNIIKDINSSTFVHRLNGSENSVLNPNECDITFNFMNVTGLPDIQPSELNLFTGKLFRILEFLGLSDKVTSYSLTTLFEPSKYFMSIQVEIKDEKLYLGMGRSYEEEIFPYLMLCQPNYTFSDDILDVQKSVFNLDDMVFELQTFWTEDKLNLITNYTVTDFARKMIEKSSMNKIGKKNEFEGLKGDIEGEGKTKSQSKFKIGDEEVIKGRENELDRLNKVDIPIPKISESISDSIKNKEDDISNLNKKSKLDSRKTIKKFKGKDGKK